MARETIECAVMFADIAGSTALYDKYGDDRAKATIEDCISRMADVTGQCNGIVIKTIGDEIMCRFDSATEGVNAAISIQEAMNVPSGPERILLFVRIGIHAGNAILENNDVFGDAVNMAARMTAIARARQIITTQDTYSQLSVDLQEKSREFDITAVKGKAEKITIYDIMWDADDDVTTMSFTPTQSANDVELKLSYQGQEKILSQDDTPIEIGRSKKIEMTIDTSLASRNHARVEYNRGKFILIDQSTNGTYVKLSDGKEVYLRREELPLSSNGSFCLGERVNETNSQVILFSVS